MYTKFKCIIYQVHSVTAILLNFHPVLCVCEGDDRRSRQGRRWRGEPAGVPAYYEENLPLLKEERKESLTCDAAHISTYIFKSLNPYYCVVPCVSA